MTPVIFAYCTRSLIINTIVICNIFPVAVDTSSDNEKEVSQLTPASDNERGRVTVDTSSDNDMEVSQLTPAVTMRRKCHS